MDVIYILSIGERQREIFTPSHERERERVTWCFTPSQRRDRERGGDRKRERDRDRDRNRCGRLHYNLAKFSGVSSLTLHSSVMTCTTFTTAQNGETKANRKHMCTLDALRLMGRSKIGSCIWRRVGKYCLWAHTYTQSWPAAAASLVLFCGECKEHVVRQVAAMLAGSSINYCAWNKLKSGHS